MLTKNEDKIMFAVYSACKEKTSALLSPDDILSMANVRGEVSYDALEKILEALEYDDYFDLIRSDRKGEKVYCITLHEKGQGYKRQKTIVKRNVGFKVTLAVIGGLAIGLLLKAIFT